MRSAVRALGELGAGLVLAPERQLLASRARDVEGTLLGDLVVERGARMEPEEARSAIVLDTSHARDGVLDVAGAIRDAARASAPKSAKKVAAPGDLLVSRLRPYLRQIALVTPGAVALAAGRPIAVSTEFYVLSPRATQLRTEAGGNTDLAFLVPLLLSASVQGLLAEAQEGGHHPRVPRASLLALSVPREVLDARVETSRRVRAAFEALYRASNGLRELLDG